LNWRSSLEIPNNLSGNTREYARISDNSYFRQIVPTRMKISRNFAKMGWICLDFPRWGERTREPFSCGVSRPPVLTILRFNGFNDDWYIFKERYNIRPWTRRAYLILKLWKIKIYFHVAAAPHCVRDRCDYTPGRHSWDGRVSNSVEPGDFR
jgi:hypothetical protein